MKPYYQDEGAGITLYLGDCVKVLPELGTFDLALTDPPYGINAARDRNSQKNGWRDYGVNGWDAERPSIEVFKLIMKASKHQIIWGGNYFTDYLPPTMQWLVWDKGQRDFSLADGEFAWSSQNRAARIFTYARAAAMKDGKQHATQKPVALMLWCLDLVPDALTVLDPFTGSGTTGVACARLGRKFTGIEINEKYCEIAAKRIERELAQGSLFEPTKQPKPVQLTIS